jgi:hypothetical protein
VSYILDALTKSQRERREGGVPTLSTPQLTADPAKGAHPRYVNGALIVLTSAAVLFAAYTLIRQDDGPNPAPQKTADAPTGSTPETPLAAPSLESSPATTTPASVEPAAPSQPRPTLRRDIALTDAPIARPPRPAVPATGRPLSPAESSAPEAAPPSMSSEEAALRSIEERLFPGGAEAAHPETVRLAEELLELAGQPAPSVVAKNEPGLSDGIPLPASTMAPSSAQRDPMTAPAPSAAAAGANEMAAAPRAPDVGEALPGMRALPSDVQASLGRLTINAHVYNDVPAGRMVIINMNRYQEGERLREGPRVEAINVTGAVLSYQSYRFQLNVR